MKNLSQLEKEFEALLLMNGSDAMAAKWMEVKEAYTRELRNKEWDSELVKKETNE